MEFKNENNMSIKELLIECDAIFNTMSSSLSTTSSSSSATTTTTTTTITSTSLSTSITTMTKEKLVSIHEIFKRNEKLMEELKTLQSSLDDNSIKTDIIIEELKSNLNEIVRMYQEFVNIVA